MVVCRYILVLMDGWQTNKEKQDRLATGDTY
jgi:hypothetical protein